MVLEQKTCLAILVFLLCCSRAVADPAQGPNSDDYADPVASEVFDVTSAKQSCPESNSGRYWDLPGIWLRNQDEVTAFARDFPDCQDVGNIFIGKPYPDLTGYRYEPEISSLDELDHLISADTFHLKYTQVDTLDGLQNLKSVRYGLTVVGNAELVSAEAISGLAFIGSVSILGNPVLERLPDLSGKRLTVDSLRLAGNPALRACSGVSTLLGYPDRWPFEAARYSWDVGDNGEGCNSTTEILNSIDADYATRLGYQEPLECKSEYGIYLRSQSDVDRFRDEYGQDCNYVPYLKLEGADIVNLDGLSGILYINGLTGLRSGVSYATGLNDVLVLGEVDGGLFPALPSLVKTGMRYGYPSGGGFGANLMGRRHIDYDPQKFPRLRMVHLETVKLTDDVEIGDSALREVCGLEIIDSDIENLAFLADLETINCPFRRTPKILIRDNSAVQSVGFSQLTFHKSEHSSDALDIVIEDNPMLESIDTSSIDTSRSGFIELRVSNNPKLTSEFEISAATSGLSIVSQPNITQLPVLADSLTALTLIANPKITRVDFSSATSSLRTLHLSDTPIEEFTGAEQIRSIYSLTLDGQVKLSDADFPGTEITSDLTLSGAVQFRGFNFQKPAKEYDHALNSLSLAANDDADLSSLSSLSRVRHLSIVGSELTNLNALENLTGASTVNISDNTLLTDMSALEDLDHTNSWSSSTPAINFVRNPLITDIELGRFYATLIGSMERGSGIEEYGYVNAFISDNDALERLSVFEQTSAATAIYISNNSSLRDLNSLRRISKAYTLSVKNNAALSDCDGAWLLLGFPNFPHDAQQDNIYKYLTIKDNDQGAMSPDDCLESVVAPDADPDNDGVPNEQDAFPAESLEWEDTDADGVGNNADTDDDGDGYSDESELASGSDPLDPKSVPEEESGGLPIWLKYWVTKP